MHPCLIVVLAALLETTLAYSTANEVETRIREVELEFERKLEIIMAKQNVRNEDLERKLELMANRIEEINARNAARNEEMRVRNEEEMRDVAARNEDLERKLDVMVSQNGELERQLAVMAQQNEEMKETLEQITDTEEWLRGKVKTLEDQLQAMSSQGTSAGKMTGDDVSMRNVSHELATELPPGEDIHVAFSACLSSVQYPDYTQTAPFDLVFTNYGDAYDDMNYEFVAPVDGVYHFTVSVTTWGYYYAWLDLYHNDDLKMSVFDRDNTASSTTGAANTIILQLQAGDTVHVDMYGSGSLYHYDGISSLCYTSFAGILLFKV